MAEQLSVGKREVFTTASSLANRMGVVAGQTGDPVALASSQLGQTLNTLAKQKLDAGDVDPSIKRHIVVSPTEIQDLLNNTTVTSSDFNTVKALVQGEIDSFMGFKFHVSNRLTTNGAGNTQCIAFAEDGILLGIGKDVTARIDERSDKSYATQVYYCQTIGATRMEEAKVISVLAN